MACTLHPKVHHRPRYGTIMYVNDPDPRLSWLVNTLFLTYYVPTVIVSLRILDDDEPVM